MLHFYIGVISPVLEYDTTVWHTNINDEMSECLESLQKRSLRIIYGGESFTNSSYQSFCETLSILPLRTRRDELARNFFQKLLDPSSCLHHLIPEKETIVNFQNCETKNHILHHLPELISLKILSLFTLYIIMCNLIYVNCFMCTCILIFFLHVCISSHLIFTWLSNVINE